jgi:hypothetical protein
VYKEAYFNTNDLDHMVPSATISLLQEFDDLFPDDTPSGIPPLRGIEHQIDFVGGASIPNRPSYGRNPEEMTGLQRQVYELLDKGYIRESINPCAVPVLLMPTKDGTWRMCVVCRAINNITILIRGRILSRRREGMMRTGPETPARTHYMFRGLICGFEGFTQVMIARTIEVSMCRRGPAQLYLGHEVRTAKEPKESYHNLKTWD